MSDKESGESKFVLPDNPFVNPQDTINAKAIQQAVKKKATTEENQNITQRQYFRPADFKILQETYDDLDKYNTALVKLLRVTPRTDIEGVKLKKLMELAFEKLQKALHKFITLWTQRTAGFLGTKDEVKHVYRMLIDESKAIMTIANPPTRQQLEVVVISMKHVLSWLISQAFPFSVGEITQTTHPQLFNLEKTQLMAQSGMAYLAESNQGRFGKLMKKLPFKRGKESTAQLEGSGLPFLPPSGGNE